MFTYEELSELKRALNNLIVSKITYLDSTIIKSQREDTEKSLKNDYKLLEKVLELIDKEENK